MALIGQKMKLNVALVSKSHSMITHTNKCGHVISHRVFKKWNCKGILDGHGTWNIYTKAKPQASLTIGQGSNPNQKSMGWFIMEADTPTPTMPM